MGNDLEHLAAWRGRDPLTIPQAASLIVGVRPSAPFMTEKRTATERTGVELQVFDWYERIVLDAKSGQLRFDLKTGPAGKPTTLINERNGTIVHVYSEGGARHVPKYELSTVFVKDLCTWLESIGHRPAFFFPEPVETPPADKPLTTTEKDTLLRIVAVLAEMAGIDLRKGFKKYPAADKITPHATARGLTVTRETLANKLNAARELINPKGPMSRDPKSD